MPHHFQRKGRISRGLHEKVGLLDYRDLGLFIGDLGNGREAFHMSMPTEVQSTSSLKNKKASPLLLLPISWFALKKCFFRYSTVGGGISSAQSGSCDLSAKTRSLHKVL